MTDPNRQKQLATFQSIMNTGMGVAPKSNIPIESLEERFEYTPRDISAGENFFASLYNGSVVSFSKGVAQLVPILGQAVINPKEGTKLDDFFDTWLDTTNGLFEAAKAQTSVVPSFFEDPSAKAMAKGLGQGLGFMLTLAVGGGATGATSKYGMIASGTGVGTTYMMPQLRQEAIDAGIDKTDASRFAAAVSPILALSEYLGFRGLSKIIEAPAINMLRREAVSKAAKQFVEEGANRKAFYSAAQTMQDVMITGLKDKAKVAGTKAAAGFLLEGSQEFAQSYIQEGIEQIYDNFFSKGVDAQFGANVLGKEQFKAALEEAMYGGIIGFGMSGGGSAIYSPHMKESMYGYVESANDKAKAVEKLKGDMEYLVKSNRMTPQEMEYGSKMLEDIVTFTEQEISPNIKDRVARFQAFQLADMRKELLAGVGSDKSLTPDYVPEQIAMVERAMKEIANTDTPLDMGMVEKLLNDIEQKYKNPPVEETKVEAEEGGDKADAEWEVGQTATEQAQTLETDIDGLLEGEQPKVAETADVPELANVETTTNALNTINILSNVTEAEAQKNEGFTLIRADFGRNGRISYEISDAGSVDVLSIERNKGEQTSDKSGAIGEGSMAIASIFNSNKDVDVIYYDDESQGFWDAIGGKLDTLTREDFFKYYNNKAKSISESYHKAKSDGSNPELVQAVENLLTRKTTTNEQDTQTQAKQAEEELLVSLIDEIDMEVANLSKKRGEKAKKELQKQLDRKERAQKDLEDVRTELARLRGEPTDGVETGVGEEVGTGEEGVTQEELETEATPTEQVEELGQEVESIAKKVSIGLTPYASDRIPKYKYLNDILNSPNTTKQEKRKIIKEIEKDLRLRVAKILPKGTYQIKPFYGVWGETEISFELVLDLPLEDALFVGAKLGKEFDQDAVHVRQFDVPVNDNTVIGVRNDDGSATVPYATIEFNRSLTNSEFYNILKEVGLLGGTLSENGQFALIYNGQIFEKNQSKEASESNKSFSESVKKLKNYDSKGIQGNVKRVGSTLLHEQRRSDGEYGGRGTRSVQGTYGWYTSKFYNKLSQKVKRQLESEKDKTKWARESLKKPIAKALESITRLTPKIKNENARDYKRLENIGKIFDKMVLTDMSPEVVKAYSKLAKALLLQYKDLPIKVYPFGKAVAKTDKNGRILRNPDGSVQVEFIPETTDTAYDGSGDMINDVDENNQMVFYTTGIDTFGEKGVDYTGHPLLEQTGINTTRIPVVDKNGNVVKNSKGETEYYSMPMVYNDLLRIVHDYIAHAASGATFGARGEERAWAAHVSSIINDQRINEADKLDIIRALTIETRGQNTWVNFISEKNKKVNDLLDQRRALIKEGKPVDEINKKIEELDGIEFSDQKVGLLPTETIIGGYAETKQNDDWVKRNLTGNEYVSPTKDGGTFEEVKIEPDKADVGDTEEQTAEQAPQVRPQRQVKANQKVATQEVAEARGEDVKDIEVLYSNMFRNLPVIDDTDTDAMLTYETEGMPTGLEKDKVPPQIRKRVEKLMDKGYVYYNEGNFYLTPKGAEIVDAIDARLETRKGVKEGTDLFPDEANIEENKLTTAEAKSVADKIRGLKINTKGKAFDATLGLPVAIYNGAVELIATSVEGGMMLKNAIAKAMKYIDEQMGGKNWNKGLFAKDMNVRFAVTLPNGERAIVERDTSKKTAKVIDGWYLPIEQKVLNNKQDKMPANNWAGLLRSKEDEDLWTGVRQWLEEKGTESVSKKEIQDFINNNRIELVNVVKSNINDFNYSNWKESEEESDFDIQKTGRRVLISNDGYKIIQDPQGGYDLFSPNGDKVVEDKRSLNLIKESYNEIVRKSPTKHAQYQLEGEKENYKEVLVTLPSKTTKTVAERLGDFGYSIDYDLSGDYWIEKNGEIVEYDELPDSVKSIVDKIGEGGYDVSERKIGDFKSSHWDEPNIVVHLRMNTRTDADGNKVLFLEEIQSDWSQQGRKKGFGKLESDKETERLKEEYLISKLTFEQIEEELDRQYLEKKKDGESRSDLRKRDSNFNKLALQYIPAEQKMLDARLAFDKHQAETRDIVPTAPFVTDTNSWVKLGLKVAMQEAVKQGVDKIAWSTGTQQFDRWGSEKISWKKEGNKWKLDIREQVEGTAFEGVNVDEKALSETNVSVNSKERLRQVIKANLARERTDAEIDKLTDRIWNRMQTEDSGTSLPRKEGMEGFYGVPSENSLGIVGGVASKLFGQEVGTVTLGDAERFYIKKKSANNFEVYSSEDGFMSSFETETEANDYAKDMMYRFGLKEQTQHSIEVTPELKREVERGLPMFGNVDVKIGENTLGSAIAGANMLDQAFKAGVDLSQSVEDNIQEMEDKGIIKKDCK